MKELCGAETRRIALLGAILAAMAGGGCGDNHNTGSGETPVGDMPSPAYAPAPVTTDLLASGEFSLPARQGGTSATEVVPFSSAVAGSLTAQVTWHPACDAMAIGIYAEGCTREQLPLGACKPVHRGQPQTSKNYGSVTVGQAPKGRYVLGIQNGAAQPEAGAYQVVVSH